MGWLHLFILKQTYCQKFTHSREARMVIESVCSRERVNPKKPLHIIQYILLSPVKHTLPSKSLRAMFNVLVLYIRASAVLPASVSRPRMTIECIAASSHSLVTPSSSSEHSNSMTPDSRTYHTTSPYLNNNFT